LNDDFVNLIGTKDVICGGSYAKNYGVLSLGGSMTVKWVFADPLLKTQHWVRRKNGLLGVGTTHHYILNMIPSSFYILCRMYIDIACSAWDLIRKREIDHFEMVQHRAVRFVASRHRNTSSVGDILNTWTGTVLKTGVNMLDLSWCIK